MEESKRMDLLFYELASESRLDILRVLCESNLKMQELARKIDVTATEATRQLQRLSHAKLIERQPEGTYATTQVGKLLLSLSGSMEFVYKNTDYFLEHNISQLPVPFINRLGELSKSILIADLPENMSRWEAMTTNAEKYLWVMTPKAMTQLSRTMVEKLLKGTKLRSIFSDNARRTKGDLPSGKNVERKTLPVIPAMIMTTEKEATLSFPRKDGNLDFPTFFGNDSLFLKWVEDLFLYYWEQAKIWHPNSSAAIG